MPSNFPLAIDNLSNPSGTTGLDGSGLPELSHSIQHANANDAIEIIETVIGVTNSTDPNSIIFKLNNQSNSTISITGDISGTGETSISTSLALIGTAGEYTKVMTDGKGRVISGSNPQSLLGYGIKDAYTKIEIDNRLGDIESALVAING